MSAKEPDGRAAEVLRLHYLEGASVRLISRKMGLARRTVRQILGRKPSMPEAPRAPRSRSLDPYRDAVRTMLSDAPEMRATSILERLRPMGYRGALRSSATSPASFVRVPRARCSSRSRTHPGRSLRSTGPTSGSRSPAALGV